MANQVIEGVIIQIPKAESGESKSGKAWNKQEFVVETKEKFPNKVCLSLFGDKTSLLSNFSEGMEVSVSYNLESRDFNGKWFHNINAWKIESIGSQATGYSTGVVDPKNMSIKDQIMESKKNEPVDEDDTGLPF